MLSIFDPSFWFDLTPVRLSPWFEKGFFVLFALMLIAGAVLRMRLRAQKMDSLDRKILDRLVAIFFTAGGFGFLWLFFSFEEVQLFGSRAWFLLWIALVVYSLVRTWMFAKREVPALRAKRASQADANKYLPKRNR